MFKRFILYIEQKPWDEEIERQFHKIDRVCLIIIVLAALYFSPSIINILTR